ncbi:pleckstrin homology-like domain family B member 1 isoform X2 [Phlebotomus papatasi]|uniref:pleckstrin homology-like domain family B member 1 isoform X2 n=1 Tax=Phlebotomus papatasi TaxID=29031 RepID=UPI0024844FED|nr:pleckstrin homology-like domain family B member 1 isoform X2 [Phlebotomus papatasi]
MSLKKSDQQAIGSGLRVAAGEPHLVSLGGGRLSTAVTIHHLPIGDLTIGSSPSCGVILNGSGVLPVHCTLYRNEEGNVLLVPEPEGRTLVDGNRVSEEVNLTQGAMLTIGKSNYLRFNNPAEAELIRSTIGSNERISMPQIDFRHSQDDTSGKNKNLKDSTESHEEDIAEKLTKIEYANIKNFHCPKVFTADSVTVNTPAKDVLGPKYKNFTKNLTNSLNNSLNNLVNSPSSSSIYENAGGGGGGGVGGAGANILTTFNNLKVTPTNSATYDRYPKPFGLQVFPMNGVNAQINNESSEMHQRAQKERLREQEMSKAEQERLEEILQLCAEYERQNQSIQSSPIVQNRIKTNGSLPREKKSPFGEVTSPFGQDKAQQIFFPPDDKSRARKLHSGYENVVLNPNTKRAEISPPGADDVNKKSSYVPQSPRTKIRTTVSPKSRPGVECEKRSEYEILLQSFEERQKAEANKSQDLRFPASNQKWDDKLIGRVKSERNEVLMRVRELKTQIADLQRQEDEVLRELDMEKALVNAELSSEFVTLNEMRNELSALQSKIHRLEAQRNANRVMQETQQAKLRQKIEMLQDQVAGLEKMLRENGEDRDLREELSKALESLENDRKVFEDLEFQYLEEETDWLAYREELHNDLKGLNKSVEDQRNQIMKLELQRLENQQIACTDTKVLEKNLLTLLTDLEKSRETLKAIDKKLFLLSGGQEPSTAQSESDDDADLLAMAQKTKAKDRILSQSLYGSEEILARRTNDVDVMSKSVNENMFFDNLEMPSSTPKKALRSIDVSEDITNLTTSGHSLLRQAEDVSEESTARTPDSSCSLFKRKSDSETDPLLKLKYELSPDGNEKNADGINLNLSLESDDFEVNPLERRIPSQDDIDRITKLTTEVPIDTEGASNKVRESIKEIERNRQLLLTQQGCHVIEHERQKMFELKKKSHDEARAQYLRLHINSQSDSVESAIDDKDTALEGAENSKKAENHAENIPLSSNTKMEKSSQRHSNPEFDGQQQPEQQIRPLSEVNEDKSYDVAPTKAYKSTSDICTVPSRQVERSEVDSGGSQRNSVVSQSATSDGGGSNNGRLVAGSRRNLPKHQRPLTRYLPIMSQDLDLRQHIETAGHQINLCPHVIVDSSSCRGYLHKLGATFHGWSRRWFVLDRQKEALVYFSDKSERKPRGGSYFTTIDEVYLDHMNTSKSGRPHCTFIVKTKKRSYHLQAASDAAARIWIDAIITGAQGNIDY